MKSVMLKNGAHPIVVITVLLLVLFFAFAFYCIYQGYEFEGGLRFTGKWIPKVHISCTK